MSVTTIFAKGIFDGHVAIVTGGGSGIGLSTALALGSLGARVAICGRKKEKLDEASKLLAAEKIEHFAGECDIREVDQITAFVDAVKEKLGRASILVNNAGGQFPTTADTVSARGWETVIRNNLNGTFFMTQAVATKHMMPARRGRIVNVIANIARGFPGMVHTGAARAGVENMTKTLAVEWAQYNVQVNAIAPGIVRTTGTAQYPPELIAASVRKTPMKRAASAGEVAQLIVYLACDAAHFVTGECWYIDGGAHLWGDNWTIPDEEPPPPPSIVTELAK